MRALGLPVIAFLVAWTAGSARADTCNDRSEACLAACTPRQVESGAQFGGTVHACRRSCSSRLRSCLRTGTWIHMGARRRGEQERMERE